MLNETPNMIMPPFFTTSNKIRINKTFFARFLCAIFFEFGTWSFMILAPSMQFPIFNTYDIHKFLNLTCGKIMNANGVVKNRLFPLPSILPFLLLNCVNFKCFQWIHTPQFLKEKKDHLSQVPLLDFPYCHTLLRAFVKIHTSDFIFSS